jgi:hypothetical protein
MTAPVFRWLIPALLLVLTGPADAGSAHPPHRSAAVLHALQKAHPCPATGKATGPCPGYVKDHIKPLACGGADAVENLQWQTAADAKAKDRWERKGC